MLVAKTISILIIQILTCTVCFAQEEKIDSLKKELPLLKNSARVDCLNELSGIYLKYYDALSAHFIPDTPKYYADVAYKESKRLNYIHGIAESLSYKAEFEYSHDHFQEAEEFSREALYWYKKTANKKRMAETYFTFGRALYAQSEFAEAIKNVDTSYMLYEKSRNANGICWAVVLAAWIYEASGNYEKAFELARESLNLAIKNNDDFLRKSQLSLIGNLFRGIEDYKTALDYYRQSSENAKEGALGYAELFTLLHQYDSAKYYYDLIDTASPRIRRAYLTSIGEYYFEQKLYSKALLNFTMALYYHKQLNDRNPVMQTLVDIAKTYLALGNDDSAFAYGNESFILAKQTGARQIKKAACEILSSVYDHWHRGDSAYLYYKQYTSIKDSVLNDQVKGKLAAYTFEQKMELLNKEKQIQQVQLQKQSLVKNILIGSIIIILLFAAVIFRNLQLKRKDEAHRRESAENELQIQKLESEKTKASLQQQATELEMQALRAQMNPHFIFNCLNAINGFILVNQSETAADYLTKFSRLIRMVLNNSQRKFISLDDELETLDLYLYMEKLRFTDNFHYYVNCNDTIDALSIFIPPMLLQPFAENAIWHGLMHKQGDRELHIDLHRENNTLHCIITDNGVGRKNAASLKSKSGEKNKSMGLQITKNRMALLNGDLNGQSFFEITDLEDESGNATGTAVSLKIKIKETIEESAVQNIE